MSQSIGPETLDAALFTNSLSIIDRWQDAYAQTLARVRLGGRIVVVDMALPVGRAPSSLLLKTTSRMTHRIARGGHIHVAAGSRP